MFLFLRKYGVEMSRTESPVSSCSCADLAAPNWRRRIGGAELSHSDLIVDLNRFRNFKTQQHGSYSGGSVFPTTSLTHLSVSTVSL